MKRFGVEFKVVELPFLRSGVTIGNVIFIHKNPSEYLLNHEVGHLLQRKMKGVKRFFFEVQLPSFLNYWNWRGRQRKVLKVRAEICSLKLSLINLEQDEEVQRDLLLYQLKTAESKLDELEKTSSIDWYFSQSFENEANMLGGNVYVKDGVNLAPLSENEIEKIINGGL